jgi:beta-lactamase class D
MGRADRARQSIVRHDSDSLGLRFCQNGVGRNDGDGRIFTRAVAFKGLRIGLIRMTEAVNRLDYGNRAVGQQVDTFWLRGPLAISAVEQLRFLDRLARGSLPFPAAAQRAVREITVVEQGPGWVLHAKTGWQNGPGAGVGWWVGWVERGRRVTPFALNLDIRQRADGDLRQRLGREALARLGLLPAATGKP